ncbi:MAG: M48 family metalloprotease [Leptolyngbya sp. SIO4C1]|nr:M48 family metalloprotease [Leptolyngbya sp. SIO4C1]
MSKALFLLKTKLSRRIAYGFMAFIATLSFGLAVPQPSQAGLLDLIFNGIQVIQISNMSDEQERNLGRQINDQLVRRGEFRLYNNQQVNQYVSAIGQRLVPHSDRSDIPYTFQVVQDDSINAFATVGGYVYVTTGLLQAADNEAEVASVLSHEVGHIAKKHALNQMRQAAIAQGIAGALGVNRDQLVNIGVQVALQLPASREDEYEADEHGFYTMGEAGYDQAAMVSFMQKLVRRGSPPEFLSTHPDARNRVNGLQRLLNEEAIPTATDGMSPSNYDAQIAALR